MSLPSIYDIDPDFALSLYTHEQKIQLLNHIRACKQAELECQQSEEKPIDETTIKDDEEGNKT